MSGETQAVIGLCDVCFGYQRATPVVDSVCASLLPGRVTALVGPNAAGKSTLLRLMLGLARPWSGSVAVGGLAVHQLPAKARARWLSYVPQRPGVRFGFTVRQVVAMGQHAQDAGNAHRVEQALADAGIDPLADRAFAQLSGGQQQRVLLARAELQSSGGGCAMLLDEPGSHLDLRHRHATMRRLRTLAERGLAVLVVLHDLDLAVRYADDAWLMDRGKLVAAGRWDAVLTPDLLGPVYGLGLRRVEQPGDRPALLVQPVTSDTMPMQTADESP